MSISNENSIKCIKNYWEESLLEILILSIHLKKDLVTSFLLFLFLIIWKELVRLHLSMLNGPLIFSDHRWVVLFLTLGTLADKWFDDWFFCSFFLLHFKRQSWFLLLFFPHNEVYSSSNRNRNHKFLVILIYLFESISSFRSKLHNGRSRYLFRFVS